MEPIEQRLEKIEALVQENHRLLVKLRRVQRNANLFRLFYWLVIVGLGLGAFYYIQPYIQQLTNLYSGLQTTQDSLINASIPDVKYLDTLLKQLQGN